MARTEILEESKGIFEEGREYKWQIKSIGDQVEAGKSHYREWIFSTFIDGNAHELKINLFPWMVMPIVEGMGAVKVDGKIKVDYDELEGKSLYAKFATEKTISKKDGKEYTNRLLKDYRKDETTEDIPF